MGVPVILLIVTLAAAGTIRSVRTAEKIILKTRVFPAGSETNNNFSIEVSRIIKLLENDPSPGSDSVFDPVQRYVREKSYEYREFTLTDISSGLNPNYINTLLFVRTGLKETLEYGTDTENFILRRAEHGFSMNIEEIYSGILKKDAMEEYFTPYGYLNVNVSSGYSCERMFLELTMNANSARRFRSRIENSLKDRHIITEEDLRSAAGDYYKKIALLMTVLPQINVNFADSFILKQILSYPYGGIPFRNGSSILNRLIVKRSEGEITPADLAACIPAVDLQKRIFQYLGTKTWFWELKISDRDNTAKAVIACIPSRDGSAQKYDYKIFSFN